MASLVFQGSWCQLKDGSGNTQEHNDNIQLCGWTHSHASNVTIEAVFLSNNSHSEIIRRSRTRCLNTLLMF